MGVNSAFKILRQTKRKVEITCSLSHDEKGAQWSPRVIPIQPFPTRSCHS